MRGINARAERAAVFLAAAMVIGLTLSYRPHARERRNGSEPIVMAPPLSVTVSDLPNAGVTLVSPDDARFDDLARPLIGSYADRLLALKPLLVIVQNRSPKTIVAVSVVWTLSNTVGRERMWTNSTFPNAVIGVLTGRERAGIRPDESHIVASDIVVEHFDQAPAPEAWLQSIVDDFLVGRNETMTGVTGAHIALDAVIFQDGTLAGSDGESRLAKLFGERVAARQQWLREIATALAAGRSVEEAYAPLIAFQTDVRQQHGWLPSGTLDERITSVEKTNAAADIARFRTRVGDARLPAALAALNLQDFSIHRAPTRPE
jgi:hypothetical protein